MKRFVGCVVLSFGICLSALAANPRKVTFSWGLKGTYGFQLSNVHQRSWGADFPCTYTDQNNVTHTVTVHAGGSSIFNTIDDGVVVFDGVGKFAAAFTEYHQFDQLASNLSVGVGFDASCNTTIVSNGAPIFKDVNMVIDGTYDIGDSFGSLTTTDGKAVNIIVGGASVGVCFSKAGGEILYPSTVLMHEVGGVQNGVGTAVFQDVAVLCH